MRTREEVMKNMVAVATALEREGLTEEQKARGNARYAELEEELRQIEEAEKKAQEAAETADDYVYPTNIWPYVKKIRDTLGYKPKVRRK